MKIGNLEVYGIIYKITNLINGKVYIGQTVRGYNKRYKYNLEKYTHNEHLKNSIHKYSLENFKINKVIDIAFSKEELDVKEKCYIQIYKSMNNKYGYNKDYGGTIGLPNKETKIKMSKALKQRWNNKEYKDKMKQKIKDTHWRPIMDKNPRASKVICLNTKEIFSCGKMASKKYRCNYSHLIECCNYKRKSCGRDKNNKKLLWMYYEDYLKKDKKTINKIINDRLIIDRNHYNCKGKNNPNYGKGYKIVGSLNKNSKKVVCVTTNKIFDCITKASEYYKCDRVNISCCCKNKRKHCGKLENGTKLQWMYYNDYINKINIAS